MHGKQPSEPRQVVSMQIKGVSDIQPPDTDQQLASTETSTVEGPAPNTGRPSKNPTETRPASVQVTVTEDSARSGRSLDDSGCGPSLWTGELSTPDGSRAEAAGANRYNGKISSRTLRLRNLSKAASSLSRVAFRQLSVVVLFVVYCTYYI